MTYPPPGGTPDPYQPPQQFGPPPSDPTAAPSSDQPYGAPSPYGTPTSDQPYGAQSPYGTPTSGQPYGAQSPYSAPISGQPFGAPPPPAYAYGPPGDPYGSGNPATANTNALAILALVFGIIFPPVGIVLGHMAKRQIRETGDQGKGMATAGLVLGYLLTAFIILMCALGPLLFIFGVAADDA